MWKKESESQYSQCAETTSQHSSLRSEAHDAFIKQYPQIFLREKTVLPKVSHQVDKRKSALKLAEKKHQPVMAHNISAYLREARGGPSIDEKEITEEKFQEFLNILKKLPVYRTTHEHNMVWKILQSIPELTSQFSNEDLKILSKKVISETWIKGSTVIGDDGLYVLLTGQARRRVKVFRSLIEENDSIITSLYRDSFLFDAELQDSTVAQLYVPSKKLIVKQWGIFGSLKDRAEMDERDRSVVTDYDCEILKIAAKEYEKLKLEKVKHENAQKLKLIRKCPFYETWPTLSIWELVSICKFKNFPPGHALDPVTKELMIQTAKPTFGHLTEEDVKSEYIKSVQAKEWKYFKNKTIQRILHSNGVLPGFGRWEHYWPTFPKNLKKPLISYS